MIRERFHMMMVVAYDIETTDNEGKRRLQRIAKLCERYGMRVQNSVYEMLIDPRQFDTLKGELRMLMDPETDTVRCYRLGNNYESRIEVLGKRDALPVTGLLEI